MSDSVVDLNTRRAARAVTAMARGKLYAGITLEQVQDLIAEMPAPERRIILTACAEAFITAAEQVPGGAA